MSDSTKMADAPGDNVDEDRPFSPLVGMILTKMFQDSAATTNALVSNLTHQADQARAELDLVRERVEDLLSGPYMPTPDTLRSALWPTSNDVRQRMELNKAR